MFIEKFYVKSLVNVATCISRDDFSGQFFVFLRLLFFCFVVAICDLVHDVETIFHFSYVLTASEIFSEI